MHEIKCPHCERTFTVDEAGYASIVNQVRDEVFESQLHERLEIAEREKRGAVALAEANANSERQELAAAKDAKIQELAAKLEASAVEQKLAVAEAISAVEKERDSAVNELETAKHDRRAAEELAEARLEAEVQRAEAVKDAKIQELESKLGSTDLAKKIEITQALNAVEKERDELRNGLEKVTLERTLAEASLKDRYETQLKDRDDAIERLRDMKAKLSTKMVGETLEQHCEIEFNRLRSTAFPMAHFEKDNDARSGSKGDYIFRDSDSVGTEIVSIMFEMKNESDTTATKKKNEDFLKELDKDRVEKGCEYAILVSLLEPDDDLYNTGSLMSPTVTPKCT